MNKIMTAKEFFEKNRGEYFMYNGEKVRVVGYNLSGSFVVITCIGGVSRSELNFVRSCIHISLFDAGEKLYVVDYRLLSKISGVKEKCINLCKLLSGQEGEWLYSTIYGEVEIIDVKEAWVYFKVGKTHRDAVDKLGRIYEKYNGECPLFPSKENRNWSTYRPKVVLPENSVVMVADDDAFRLRFYRVGNKAHDAGFDSVHSVSAKCWKYIVPIADYDMNATFEENCKKSIV